MSTLITLKKTLLAASLAGIVACSPGQSDAEKINSARQHLSTGDLATATIELKNVLQANGNNGEARQMLGTVYLQAGDPASAEKELRRALELGADNATVVPALAVALLKQQKFQEVMELEPPAGSDAAAQNLMVSMGLAELGLGNERNATLRLESVLEQSPDSLYGLEGTAKLQAATGKTEASRETLAKILELDPNYGPAWSLLGQMEQGAGQDQQALEAYTRAIDLTLYPADDLLRRALLEIVTEDLEAAENDIDTLEQLAGKTMAANYARGLLAFHREDYQQAQQIFDGILGKTDDFLPVLYYAGASHLRLGHPNQAEQNLSQFVSRTSNLPGASMMLASIKLSKGEYQEAERLLTLVLEEDANNPTALEMLAQALVAQGDTAQAVEVLEELNRAAPDSSDAKIALAAGYEANGDIDEAVAQLQKIIALEPDLPLAPANLVSLYLRLGKNEEALALAADFANKHRDLLPATTLLASTQLSVGETETAAESFEEILKQHPSNHAANSALASLAVKGGDLDRARDYYDNILDDQPDNLQTLLNLSMLEALANEPDRTEQVLRRAIAAHPYALEPRLRLSRLLLARARAGEAAETLSDMRTRHPRSLALMSLSGEVAYATGSYAEAQGHYQRALELAPDNAEMLYELARAQAAMDKPAESQQTLAKSLELQPELHAARLAYAQGLIRQGDKEGAARELEKLREAQLEGADLARMEGLLAQANGDLAAAEAAFQRAFDQRPNNLSLLRLAAVKWQRGDQNGSLAVLENWLRETPEDTLVLLELGGRYTSSGREEDAIAVYEKVLAVNPQFGSPLALNNLAWLLRDSDPERAIKYAEQANELVPDSPSVMDTLALLLMNRGGKADLERARRLNQRAMNAAPGNASLLFRQAQLAVSAGDTAGAVALLEKLLQQNTEFPEREQAQALSDKLGKG